MDARKNWFGLRMKLLAWLAGLLGILIAVLLLANSVLVRYSESIQQLFAQDYDSAAACQVMNESLERLLERAQGLAWDARTTDHGAGGADADVAAFEQKLAVQKGISDLPGEAEATERLTQAWVSFRSAYGALADPRRNYAERHEIFRTAVLPRATEIRAASRQIIDMNLAKMETGRGGERDRAARAQWKMHALAAAGIGVAGMIVLVAGVTVLRPLRLLERSAHEIARGNLEMRVPVRAQDEIGQLGRAFNDMAAQLREFKRIDHEKLLRTQRTTQLAIDSLPDAVVLAEPRGTIELTNETAARLFSLRPGMRVTDMPSPWLSDLHQQALSDGQSRLPTYAAALRVDDQGQQRSFLPRTFPILDEHHRVIGSAIVLADVTELRRLDEMKNHLLATTAHELKTPLTSMRMAMHLIAEERDGLDARQRELLCAARDDSDRLHHIVETLLDMDRLTSGRALLELRPVAAQELVEAAVEDVRAELSGRGLALRVEVPQQMFRVRADRRRMLHVFGNLIDNAMRYTPAGGTITLALKASNAGVDFVVADTGVGIAESLQFRVFERFFRAPGQSGESGTGLGLAIAKEIVEAHGGRIWVQSREGNGTSVHFVLPVEGEQSHEVHHDQRK